MKKKIIIGAFALGFLISTIIPKEAQAAGKYYKLTAYEVSVACFETGSNCYSQTGDVIWQPIIGH